MQIENLEDGRKCYILDQRIRIVIGKGGEDIANNTYGFEVEFCSHDSSVFTFTHVDVATFGFALPTASQNQQQAQLCDIWRIESDSGGVLELVTPPLRFPTVAEAQAFRAKLIETLMMSLQVPQPIIPQEDVIKGVLLEDWWITYSPASHGSAKTT